MTGPLDPSTAMTGRTEVRTPGVGVLEHDFDTNGLPGMRAAVAMHARALGAHGESLEHLLIVASELANNAIRHGGGTGWLRLWRTGDCLYCQVSDQGPGIAAAELGVAPPSPSQIGGRGLWIVRRLSERLNIASTPRGAVVTAVLLVPLAATRADRLVTPPR